MGEGAYAGPAPRLRHYGMGPLEGYHLAPPGRLLQGGPQPVSLNGFPIKTGQAGHLPRVRCENGGQGPGAPPLSISIRRMARPLGQGVKAIGVQHYSSKGKGVEGPKDTVQEGTR